MPSIKDRHEAIAAAWNQKYPIGTRVTRYKLIDPLREGTVTATRAEAWVMGGHSVMVMVGGVAGGVLLESVVPIPEGQCCDRPRGFVGGTCDYCGGIVEPDE